MVRVSYLCCASISITWSLVRTLCKTKNSSKKQLQVILLIHSRLKCLEISPPLTPTMRLPDRKGLGPKSRKAAKLVLGYSYLTSHLSPYPWPTPLPNLPTTQIKTCAQIPQLTSVIMACNSSKQCLSVLVCTRLFKGT